MRIRKEKNPAKNNVFQTVSQVEITRTVFLKSLDYSILVPWKTSFLIGASILNPFLQENEISMDLRFRESFAKPFC